MPNTLLKIKKFASSIGPGIFILGYVIGTGSVTTMISSGANYGMSLSWALLLSCVFSFVMIVAISRLTIFSGETIMYNFRSRISSGFAIFMIIALMLTVISSVIGVTAVVAEALQEWTRPFTADGSGIDPVWFAASIILLLFLLFRTGKHGHFLQALAVMVALMSIAFLLTAVMVMMEPGEIIQGMVPVIPEKGKPHLIIAGMVGTTMASVVLVSRSVLVHEKGWKPEENRIAERDAAISMALTFVVSLSIIACAAATLLPHGLVIENAIDMVKTLEPLAGKFASTLFVIGIVCAGISSIFPNLILLPWLISDFSHSPRKMEKTLYRILFIAVAMFGLVVPLFGGKPVFIMIASQAVSPVIMPLLIIFLIILMNKKDVMGSAKNSLLMNIALIITLFFSLYMSYTALVGFINL
jgi:Mn2+/Fe2+ NRAMP family transporter